MRRKQREALASQETDDAPTAAPVDAVQVAVADLSVSANGAKDQDGGSGRIGDLLIDRQLVTQSQLAEALLQQSVSGQRLGSLLVDLGALDDMARRWQATLTHLRSNFL